MSAPLLFLGVDGGGTKTRFTLIDGGGKILAEDQRGTTYHPQVGLDGMREALAEGINAVLASAGFSSAELSYAFFGIPAHGEDSRLAPLIDAIPGHILGHQRYTCGNDMVCGWAGSLACADGINIVAGTGSIGYGERQGRSARSGGFGEIFSDEGSAYWIAIQGLNAYSRMSDGRLARGPMHALFNAHFGLSHDLDICARIMGEEALSRGAVAQLSQLVARAANEGDAAARSIFVHAGEELAQLADTLRRQLGFAAGEAVPLSWSGGAFSAGDLLMKPFTAALHAACADFELREPKHSPDYGAALYAAKLGKHAIGE